MQPIQKFYSELKFPGCYTIDQLKFYEAHGVQVVNPYLTILDDRMKPGMQVLDADSGDGYIQPLW